MNRSEWPDEWITHDPQPCAAWRSRRFLVVAYHDRGFTRLTVNRTQIGNDGRWLDGISWDELQRLKAEAGFGGRVAVEVYPADDDVVDVANMRHLWVYPTSDEPACVWRQGETP